MARKVTSSNSVFKTSLADTEGRVDVPRRFVRDGLWHLGRLSCHRDFTFTLRFGYDADLAEWRKAVRKSLANLARTYETDVNVAYAMTRKVRKGVEVVEAWFWFVPAADEARHTQTVSAWRLDETEPFHYVAVPCKTTAGLVAKNEDYFPTRNAALREAVRRYRSLQKLFRDRARNAKADLR